MSNYDIKHKCVRLDVVNNTNVVQTVDVVQEKCV